MDFVLCYFTRGLRHLVVHEQLLTNSFVNKSFHSGQMVQAELGVAFNWFQYLLTGRKLHLQMFYQWYFMQNIL